MPSDDPAPRPEPAPPGAKPGAGFEPPWWLRNRHAQTIVPTFLPRPDADHTAVLCRVDLPDGDALALHDDIPPGWRPGGKVAVLSHGLADHHRSPLLVRLTAKLTARGVRVFRWDMRTCGAGRAWARRPYHAGCSGDLAAVVAAVLEWCRSGRDPDPDLTLFGVSLSGNVLLKYLGEQPERVPAAVGRAIAVNPPIDLVCGVESIGTRINRVYDRHFTGVLIKHLEAWWEVRPDAVRPAPGPRPRTLRGFDDWFTAPAIGCRDAADYYRQASSAQFIPAIRTPTTIITSRDDPLVPFEMFAAERVAYPECVRLVATDHGGHVGFVGRKGDDPDTRWLDWRVVEIVTGVPVASAEQA
ncbi:MAG: alpha/beta fold hydrolase [Planctomycetia bacterium]|nr:alpha/beta fold hydrolase [Planctomycetia bacterium]